MATEPNHPDHYKFHLIFKGLFRCVPDRKNNRLSVLLVDAHAGKISEVTQEPLRDHRAVLEFRLEDWRNPTDKGLADVIQVKKPKKGDVGLYLLNQQDIRVGTNNGELSPGLKFVEDDSPNDFRRLPQLEEVAPPFAPVLDSALQAGLNCIARVLDLDHGEVRSERPSTFEGSEVKWAFSRPRPSKGVLNPAALASDDLEELKQDLETAKVINLDVRVTTEVPNDASVLLDVNRFTPHASDPPAFVLRPSNGSDLEVWVKNRELEVILTESDQVDQEEGPQADHSVDSDFELHYQLSAAAEKTERKVPYRDNVLEGPVAAGGCACGGCTGGGPGG